MILKSLYWLISKLTKKVKCSGCWSRDVIPVAGDFMGSLLYLCKKCHRTFIIERKDS